MADNDRMDHLRVRARRSGVRVTIYGLMALAVGVIAAVTGHNAAGVWVIGAALTVMGPLLIAYGLWLGRQSG